MRASVRALRAARSSGVPIFFFRFIVLLSLEVAENRLHVDVQIGECTMIASTSMRDALVVVHRVLVLLPPPPRHLFRRSRWE